MVYGLASLGWSRQPRDVQYFHGDMLQVDDKPATFVEKLWCIRAVRSLAPKVVLGMSRPSQAVCPMRALAPALTPCAENNALFDTLEEIQMAGSAATL